MYNPWLVFIEVRKIIKNNVQFEVQIVWTKTSPSYKNNTVPRHCYTWCALSLQLNRPRVWEFIGSSLQCCLQATISIFVITCSFNIRMNWFKVSWKANSKSYNFSIITFLQFESLLSETGSQYENENLEHNLFSLKLILFQTFTSLSFNCIQLIIYHL